MLWLQTEVAGNLFGKMIQVATSQLGAELSQSFGTESRNNSGFHSPRSGNHIYTILKSPWISNLG